MSMSIVIGNVAQIMTRYLSMDIIQAPHWDFYVYLSTQSKDQLRFWENELPSLNCRRLFESHSCSKIFYTDASSYVYGGYEVSTVNGVAHGVWSPDEMLKSSTWRELMAVYRVLLSLVQNLRFQRVKWFTDNQSVSKIVANGSMVPELQETALDIYRYCASNSIIVEMEWIPRSENDKGDYLSKIVDYDDWGVSQAIVDMVQNKWGNLEVDWFASDFNAKLPCFYTRFWNKGSSGIDAFTENWSGKFGLFVPPICILPRVIRKMITDHVFFGVLIVPYWPSSSFWPLLCPLGTFTDAVLDWMYLPTSKSFYTICKNGKRLFGNKDLNFQMLALLVKF
ncbi:uncharacterized protein LOC128234345 [Mya arenaria]|uniref:uncharacterized protein LOC128234345 n=1 Tax=Mya arenaria TaxID=6604 RepID=UPI0022E3C9C0|nr:uncharacterized protein LOC128234345 [Mya arenaria]